LIKPDKKLKYKKTQTTQRVRYAQQQHFVAVSTKIKKKSIEHLNLKNQPNTHHPPAKLWIPQRTEVRFTSLCHSAQPSPAPFFAPPPTNASYAISVCLIKNVYIYTKTGESRGERGESEEKLQENSTTVVAGKLEFSYLELRV